MSISIRSIRGQTVLQSSVICFKRAKPTNGSKLLSGGGCPHLPSPGVLIRRSAPLGVSSLAMNQIYYSLETLVLGWLRATEVVGLYMTPYKIPLALIWAHWCLGQRLLSALGRAAATDPTGCAAMLGLVSTFSIVVAAMLITGAALTGRHVVEAPFGVSSPPPERLFRCWWRRLGPRVR